ncbi:uncharacterized protein BDR25DRAFT_256686 [Lindgomyces ingoldianus]|uniref:Uncharacterized protein n=1 Tax=Lindgomyces ingoldianus TaxID=673940 RepID=A0ACB6R3I4_9PLEO|nr:uncharacterized protein BDR25DRAFT_256686 [Lindgomyces ingoldianus]KAF2473804.1 hypothetical protein BDR25DRAFT_256686 [Lindgomyces ingoldianus]
MPPKRRSSGIAPGSNQSTLAFHGASNKVTKAGTRVQNAKNNLVSEPATKGSKDDIVDVDTTADSEPATAEAAIIEQAEQEVVAHQASSTPEEDEARRISEKRIQKYWKDKEAARKAPRVHQEDLSLHEKVLREWDMSGQYGPSTGIARIKRWKRAHKLNLNPPIEVLAVLLKEQEGSDQLSVQRSHVDVLLKSRAEEV